MRTPSVLTAAILVACVLVATFAPPAAAGGGAGAPPSAPAGAAAPARADSTGKTTPASGGSNNLTKLLSQQPKGANADSLMNGAPAAADTPTADSALVVDRFAPTITTAIRSSETDYSLTNGMTVSSDLGNGWTLLNNVNIEKRRYRTRDAEDVIESFANMATRTAPGLYVLDFKIGDTYNSIQTVSSARYGSHIINDLQSGGVGFSFIKPMLGAVESHLTLKAEAQKGRADFKYDRTILGSGSIGLNYAIGDAFVIGAGAGSDLRRQSSKAGTRQFGPMNSYMDTVNANMSYGAGKAKTLDVAYSRYTGVDRKVNPPRNNTFQTVNDPSSSTLEQATNTMELLNMSSQIQPFSFVVLEFNFNHSIKDQKYLVDTMLTSRKEDNTLLGTARYSYAKRGSADISVQTSDGVSDLAASVSSYRERMHQVNIGVNQHLGDSLLVTASGMGSLRQQFYLRQTTSPRDADYVYYKGAVSLKAPYSRFSATVNASVDKLQTINIDASYSGDNRTDYRYQVGPTITVRPADWISVTQDYVIKIDYSEFAYGADKNYLNRATTLNTQANFRLFPRLLFNMRNNYLMKDTGSYLERVGGKRYMPTNNMHENTMDVMVGYQVGQDFLLKANGNFRIQRNDILGSRRGARVVVSSTTYEYGGMKLGFQKTKKFGDYGNLDLDVAYGTNYGPYITRAHREFLEVNSTLDLNF